MIGMPLFLVSSISPMVIKFAGEYYANNRLDLVRGLYIKIKKLLIIITIGFFIFGILFLPQIGHFLHIDDQTLLFLTVVLICISLISMVNAIFLQAKLAFKFNVFNIILTAILKLIIGIILVYLGYAVGGAVFAILIATLSGYILTFIPLKFVFTKQAHTSKIDKKELFNYGLPSALTLFGLTAFISTDIILVKHFFSPEQAGIYAGLALVGKVIYYVSSPIGGVMFPILVQKHSRNERTRNTYIMAVGLVLASSISLTIFYSLFPDFTLLFFLKKSEYLTASNLLGLYALFITLYSLLAVNTNFYLSIKKTKVFIPVLIGAIAQAILISIFHTIFLHIILISLSIAFLLNLILLLYYPYATKR
jgi:O-antigen/teichoic acid export membrane protein